MRRCLLLSSLIWLATTAFAGDYLLPLEGRQQFTVAISARGMELTGVCIIKTDETGSRGAIVNEFGVSAIAFTYDPRKDKVRIVSATDKLDKWYIRRMLRHDLRECLHCLQQGVFTYENKKRGMTYMFSPQDNPLTSQQ